MKLTLFFSTLFLAFINLTLLAQPVLDYGENYYTLGDVISTDLVDPTGFDDGPDGANQSWDYSSMNLTGLTFINEVIAPSATAQGASFPTCNIALTDETAGMITYFIQEDDQFTLMGSAIDMINQVIVFDNTQIVFTWPFTMDSEISDTYSASYINSGFPATQTGEITTTAVGYGTITLPNSTVVENALKLRREQSIINTITISEDNESVSEVNITTHFWMIPSTPRAVLIHSETGFIINGETQDPVFQLQMLDPGNVKVDEQINMLSAHVSVFPNPSSDFVNISFNTSQSDKYAVRIFTPDGRVVGETSGMSSAGIDTRVEFPVSTFANGSYFVEVSIGNSYKSQRVFIKS